MDSLIENVLIYMMNCLFSVNVFQRYVTKKCVNTTFLAKDIVLSVRDNCMKRMSGDTLERKNTTPTNIETVKA